MKTGAEGANTRRHKPRLMCCLASHRPEAGSSDSLTVQEDELEAAEWQSLEQFEANPFPKTIPLLEQVRCWLMRPDVSRHVPGDHAAVTAMTAVSATVLLQICNH